MMARVAETMWVSGNICATCCTHDCAPSNENHAPDNNIIGHVTMFNMPPANSSLAVWAAINKPMEIMLIAPNVVTSNKTQYEPCILNSMKKLQPAYTMVVMTTTSSKREISWANKN